MRRTKTPTSAEQAILSVLWERGPSTVRDVHEALASTRDVGYTTVLKQMQVMVEKGHLSRTDQGRAHLYQPIGPEATAKRALVGDLMERAFGGSARDLVMHALAARPASSEEIDEIRRLLDELQPPDISEREGLVD